MNNHLFDCCHYSNNNNNNNNDNDGSSSSTTPTTYYYHPKARKKARMMDPTVEETDILVREMNELSVEEREKVLDEIHGVDKTPKETPEFVAAAIEAFDIALETNVYKKDKRALDRAIFLRPSIKTDTTFKLWFLRAEYFDAKKAANRMARYFTSKLFLFGKENLAKDATLEDFLTKKEIEKTYGNGAGLSACHTVLPNKDSSGRLVIISDTRYWDYNDNLTMIKGNWCLFMHLLKSDELVSERGIVHVVYSPENLFKDSSPATVIKGAKESGALVADSCPIRHASFHYCYNDPSVHLFLSAIHMSLIKHLRMRMRFHFGTPIEIQYSLMTFGIHRQKEERRGGRGSRDETTTTTTISNNKHNDNNTGDEEDGDITATPNISKQPPLLLLHEVDDDKHLLERIMEMERRHAQIQKEEETRTGIILYPNPNDVLVGRGKCYHDYCGNQRYQRLVEAELDKYFDETNCSFEKMCITMNMVKTIQDSGGRFLAPVAGRGWKVLDDIVARNKTAVSFRSRYSMHKKSS